MLAEVEQLQSNVDDPLSEELCTQARTRFLSSLREWGPTHTLRECITFEKYIFQQYRKTPDTKTEESSPFLANVEHALQRRLTQSAVGYLELAGNEKDNQSSAPLPDASMLVDSTADALFPLEEMLSDVTTGMDKSEEQEDAQESTENRIRLESLAMLNVMATNYSRALRYFLTIADLFSDTSVAALEQQALNRATGFASETDSSAHDAYGFVLGMIEHRHLHRCLLETDFISDDESGGRPLVALMRLVGLEVVGDFLVEHCVLKASAKLASSSLQDELLSGDVDDNLPLTVVAEQLSANRPLLYWYLELVFERKPEVYVSFPDTAVPPKAVTDLHRIHLDLHLEFARDKDSAKSLANTEAYNLESKSTPLMSFLKVRKRVLRLYTMVQLLTMMKKRHRFLSAEFSPLKSVDCSMQRGVATIQPVSSSLICLQSSLRLLLRSTEMVPRKTPRRSWTCI